MITVSMGRCFHIYDSGFQCVDETIEPTDFCEAHQNVVPFERPEDSLQESLWRKAVIRFVAFVLLAALLVPLFYTLKNLYKGTPAKAQEVW